MASFNELRKGDSRHRSELDPTRVTGRSQTLFSYKSECEKCVSTIDCLVSSLALHLHR